MHGTIRKRARCNLFAALVCTAFSPQSFKTVNEFNELVLDFYGGIKI